MYVDRFREMMAEAEKTADFQYERVVIDLTETICEIMEAKGISRTDLAAQLGKSKAWVTKLLRGDHNMTLKTVVTVLWELGYRIDPAVEPAWQPFAEDRGSGSVMLQAASITAQDLELYSASEDTPVSQEEQGNAIAA